MAISTTLHINAPPAHVWGLIDVSENLPLWMPEVIDTVYPGGRASKHVVGTRFVQRVRDAGGVKTYQGKVVAYEPGHHLALTLSETMVTISVGYRLSPDRSGTRLDFTGDLSMNNPLLGMIALAAWPMTSAILNRQIANLKRVAETVPPAVPMPAPPKRAAKAALPRARTRVPAAKPVGRKPA